MEEEETFNTFFLPLPVRINSTHSVADFCDLSFSFIGA
jgi:hypothetical protein